ncbi:hypothetical protein KY284_000867 [Solanum tuberosum]|nr:hypothetical protein KY284_000867 [Solanum tuberosum]
MFIATRTKTGKEIQVDTQVAIVCFLKRISGMSSSSSSSSSSSCASARRYQFFVDVVELLQNHQNSGETTDVRAVFGKEQPGRLRCHGRSVITSSLKKDEEINNLKQKHANEITSLKEELREEMRYLFTQLLQNNPGLNFQDIPGCVGSNLASHVDASSA